MTFTHVRPMSINSSTPKIMATPIGPSPDGTNELSAPSKMTSDARGTTAYAYDVRNRLVRLTYPDGLRSTTATTPAASGRR